VLIDRRGGERRTLSLRPKRTEQFLCFFALFRLGKRFVFFFSFLF
jgi:hypothetical protein